MSNEERRPYRVLVGTDFSDCSLVAIESALDAVRLRGGGELHIATVLDRNGSVSGAPSTRPAPSVDTMETVELQRELIGKLVRVEDRDVVFGFMHVRIGAPDRELLAIASEVNPDLIVVGTHGRSGTMRLLMGSVAERVVRHATVPVLVARKSLEPEPAALPCFSCIEVRQESGGGDWWCKDHRPHREAAHTYSYSSSFTYGRDRSNQIL